MNLLLGLLLGLIALFWFAWWAEGDECPRVIMGYNCQGKDCDHSLLELEEAKEAVGRKYWWK